MLVSARNRPEREELVPGVMRASREPLRLWVLAFVLAAAAGGACGGSGPAPSPAPSTANVAGTWVGTVGFTAGGIAGEEIFQMNLTQAAGSATVAGSYATIRFTGDIVGVITENSFRGTFEYNSIAQGQVCSGTFSVSGPAGGNRLTWTSPEIVGAPCTNTPINLVIEVERQ
jgi:hypothetical protein